MPQMYIIAGPNGAGKTTFAREFLPHYVKSPNFINADLIAQGLSPFSPSSAGLKAGRLLLTQIDEFVSQKASFTIESTLSGKTYLPLIKKIKARGYSIHIFFLWIPHVNIAKSRIKQRVEEGGHNVPLVDIVRRFKRSRQNFLKYYQPVCDSWTLFDNSSENPVMIAEQSGHSLVILNEQLFRRLEGGKK